MVWFSKLHNNLENTHEEFEDVFVDAAQLSAALWEVNNSSPFQCQTPDRSS